MCQFDEMGSTKTCDEICSGTITGYSEQYSTFRPVATFRRVRTKAEHAYKHEDAMGFKPG